MKHTKLLKTTVLALIATMMLFALSSCSKKASPADGLKAYLDEFKNKANATEMLGEDAQEFVDEFGEDLINTMLDFEYTIGETKENGDTASVEVTIKTKKFGEATTAGLENMINQAFALAFSGMSEEDMTKEMIKNFTDTLKKAEDGFEKTLPVEMKKGEEAWVLADENNPELADALSGGMISAFTEFAEGFSDLAA